MENILVYHHKRELFGQIHQLSLEFCFNQKNLLNIKEQYIVVLMEEKPGYLYKSK